MIRSTENAELHSETDPLGRIDHPTPHPDAQHREPPRWATTPMTAETLLPIDRRGELREMISMAVPVVITTGARAMMDVADYIMIARLPTHDAQAAILPAQTLMWSYIVIGLGVTSMINTYASQCLGRGQHRECSAYAWQSLYLAALFGAIGVAVIPLMPTLVRLVGHDPQVQEAEIAYLQIALLTTGPTIAGQGLGWFFIGVHRPWPTSWSAIEANIVNVLCGIVLIFGYLGFEPMGIRGAAIATLIATIYRVVRLGCTMLLTSPNAHFQTRSTWRPSWTRFRELLRTGMPYGVQWMSEVVVWAIFVNVLVGRTFGTAELIATNTAWQYLRIAFLPSIGVGQALTAVVGRAIGAGDPERAMRQVRIAAWMTLIYMGSLGVIYALFGRELISWFNDDPETLRVGASIMICTALFQLFDSLGITYSAALRGAGDTFVPSVFFIASTWLIVVGGGWIMTKAFRQMGSVGPWLSASVLFVVTALFLWYRWNGRAWMKIDLLSKRS